MQEQRLDQSELRERTQPAEMKYQITASDQVED